MDLDLAAVRKTNILAWVGLGFMSVQFGILARLTWWEYSWDIMEPVTYFVTYGTAMAAYAYYALTKQVIFFIFFKINFDNKINYFFKNFLQEYVLPEVRDRQYLITMHKKAKKSGLDLNQYNILKRQVAEIEYGN